ncbi:hypothetical protein ACH3XW_27215 [Acanthocheilonema viteae]
MRCLSARPTITTNLSLPTGSLPTSATITRPSSLPFVYHWGTNRLVHQYVRTSPRPSGSPRRNALPLTPT